MTATSGSLTTTASSGYYTKVGNKVSLWLYELSWSSHNLSGGYLRITGLPYQITSGRASGVNGGSPSGSFNTINSLGLGGDPGMSTLWLTSINSTNNTYTHPGASNVGQSGTLYGVTITYMTA